MVLELAVASLPPGCVCLLFCLNPWGRIGLALRVHVGRLKSGLGRGWRDMAQQLGMLVALAEGQSLVSCACVVAHNCLKLQFQIRCPLDGSAGENAEQI